MRGRTIARVLAGLAGGVLMAFVVQGAGLVVFLSLIAAQTPDPREPDGDPCCSYPDTWGETALWIGVPVALAAVVALGAGVAVALLTWAIHGRSVRMRRVVTILAGGAIAAVVLNAVLLAL